MIIEKPLFGEIWKEIHFDFEHTNNLKIEVSNFGRVRSFSKISNGRFLKTGMVSGYKILHLKFFKLRIEKDQIKIDDHRNQIAELKRENFKLDRNIKALKIKDNTYYSLIDLLSNQLLALEKLKAEYHKDYRIIENKRTITYGELIHRLVAILFLEKPSEQHTLVSHLDFNKLNNHVSNLKWMTFEENLVHRVKSPNIEKALAERKTKKRNENTKVYKLTSTKVMLIKKKINNGVPLRVLAKNFKVTETQILRIKRGENWANVKAAD
jgi:hypothetical protein